jgi:hypothetical protein
MAPPGPCQVDPNPVHSQEPASGSAASASSAGLGLGNAGLFSMAPWTALANVRRGLLNRGSIRAAMGPVDSLFVLINASNGGGCACASR